MARRKKYIDSRGYSRFADTGELVHIAVAEAILGRPLKRNEEVHHVDGNTTNNLPSNLKVMSAGAHRFLHSRQRYLEGLIILGVLGLAFGGYMAYRQIKSKMADMDFELEDDLDDIGEFPDSED
jgi:hypothetical protein